MLNCEEDISCSPPKQKAPMGRALKSQINHQSHSVMGMIRGVSHSRRHLALLVSIALRFK